eukprot:CAMPEP_0197453374 /NCGR_PEP_ID=MMETSP1175-20131217/34749_1 /TAXON_ID=1003142 /ORGANISM="Triceratium dubium, Strain CCMP147" /LENGTH=90 /DNA_ID=CAMNT_0042986647 /DNA_START=51 /DNA_END=319 /DNA_ORIENTATION=+
MAEKIPYKTLIVEAITNLADRTGSSFPAIEKYILANHPAFNYVRTRARAALKKALESGDIARHHQHANSYKLVKKPAPPKKKKPAKKKPA